MVTIYIDGVAFEVSEDKNLLDTCLSLGINVPYFCWHPALESVGSCRQCAVKQFRDESDTRGRVIMSCMTPLTDGMRISVTDPEAIAFREGVSEWLMLNHPHDCPICDEGGECHLQDMVVMSGHTTRRTEFPKRTYHSQELGPFIHQEMNRCIQCYRCVRFYKDYAGGDDFDAFSSHDQVFFGRQKPGTLESPFSGNLVEICPTGVFTDKTFKEHSTRKWDLQQSPSICTGCSLGCNVFPSERYGVLRRIRNRYNDQINGYFLCDRGRFGYEFVNSDFRIRNARVGTGVDARASEASVALDAAAKLLATGGQVIGIGSPRATVESNFALRNLVGEANFYAGVSPVEQELTGLVLSLLRSGVVKSATLKEVESCDAVLVLGEDPVNSAPLLELAIRQAARGVPAREVQKELKIPSWDDKATRVAAQDRMGPLFAATVWPTSLDGFSTESVNRAPQDLARIGAAIAHEIDAAAPAVAGLDADAKEFVSKVTAALKGASKPLIIGGTSLGSKALVEATANVAQALVAAGGEARVFYVLPEQNSMGLALLAAHPLSEAAVRVKSGSVSAAVIIENDLARRTHAAEAGAILDGVAVIAIDSMETAVTRKAAVVLPASTFAEASGTVVNNEGRAQRMFRVMEPAEPIQESWRWLSLLSERAGKPTLTTLDNVLDAIARDLPELSAVKAAAPGAHDPAVVRGVPRQSFRYSGRTAVHAAEDVREHRVHGDPDSSLRYSMEGRVDPEMPSLVTDYWVPGWNSVQSLTRFQEEIGGALRGKIPGAMVVENDGSNASHPAYLGAVPAAFAPKNDQFLCLPHAHIYGSEELSSMAPAVASRAPAPYVGISVEDASRHGVEAGTVITVRVESEDGPRTLPARLIPGLPAGIIVLPAGIDNWNVGRIADARITVQGGASAPRTSKPTEKDA